ncbi:MAG: hypothetical protein IKO62_04890 [Bacteroidales bacterium]|nr:hypothetical protein [Bacteroidales bacterium]
MERYISFVMEVAEVDSDSTWKEQMRYSEENIVRAKAKQIINEFNESLRPGDRPRELKGVTIIKQF